MSDSRTTSAASRAQQDDQKAMEGAVARAKAPRQELSVVDNEMITVLQSSLYPGAKPESILLVLAWCRATGRDPMKKPIHIVPMSVKNAVTGRYEFRDTLMPGIGTYRTDAANTGQYAGKSEPEFGPDVTSDFTGNVKLTHPHWCKVTVQRIVGGAVRDFTAKEFWMENYATAGRETDAPNTMWRKRPYGQLAKCAESQALRMAFPDETGNTNTAEEMEGKNFVGVTVDHLDPVTPRSLGAATAEPEVEEVTEADPAMVAFTDATCKLFAGVKTMAAREKLALEIQENLDVLRKEAPELAKRIMEAAQAAIERLQPQQQPKPAQAAQQAPHPADEPFEAWPCDDIGEPVGEEPITTPQAFAEWFEAAAERTANIEALRENNMDAIGEAGREPAAQRMISDAIAAAVKRLAKRDSERGDLREETEALDAITDAEPSLIMPIPMTPGGKFNGPKYVKDAGAEIAKLESLGAIDGWEAANLPSYAASPATKLGVDKALDARRVELGGEPVPVVDKLLEQDERLADDMLEELRPMKTPAEGDRWKARMTNQTIMARWKNDPTRHRLFHLVNDAFQKLYQTA